MSERTRAALMTAGSITLIVALLVSVVVVANTQDWLNSPTDQRRALRTALSIIVFCAVVSAALLPLLLWMMFLDIAHNMKLSPLMWPVLVVIGFLAAILVLGALAALDRLSHGLVLRWKLTNEPEMVILANALYLGLLCGLASFLAVTMLRRGWSVRATVGLFGLIVAAGALAVALVLTLPV